MNHECPQVFRPIASHAFEACCVPKDLPQVPQELCICPVAVGSDNTTTRLARDNVQVSSGREPSKAKSSVLNM